MKLLNKKDRISFRAYNLLVTFVILFVAYGCQKVDLDAIDNLSSNKIAVIGHGGIGFESTQNPLPHDSYSSIMKAVEAFGVDGVEMDIQMSADGVIFMYHDNTLETMTDCAGCILYTNSEVLKNCRYRASVRSNLFLNEKLSPVEIIFERFSKLQVKPTMILDIKEALPNCGDFDFDNYVAQFTDEIIRLIVKYDALDWCIVESEKLKFMTALKEKLPTLKLSFIPNYHTEEEIIDSAERGFYMISSRNDLISKEFSKFIHDNGLRVAIYSVKTKDGSIEAVKKSPDFIYTDNIGLLQEILR